MKGISIQLNPSAPNPSVEAILHALIPFKFVDHTHADALLTISNTPNGRKIINEIYGREILIVPYVPGFILAKKIANMTKNIHWETLHGMILLNHGVFSFSNNAKESYERMINIVTKAERFLKKANVWQKFNKSNSKADLLTLARIRKKASEITGKACIAILNDSSEAVGFSKMKVARELSVKGTLTPDHVIRTKPFAWIINDDLDNCYNKILNIIMSEKKGISQKQNLKEIVKKIKDLNG